MNQQPDKLFREKLEGLNKTIPSNAWDRVQSRLDKKNNATLWLKVAASLTLLVVATILLWPDNAGQVPVANVNPGPAQKPAYNKPAAVLPETNDTGKTQVSEVQKNTVREKSKRTKAAIKKADVNHEPVILTEKPIEDVTNENDIPQQETFETEIIAPVTTVAHAPSENDGVTIVLTAEEVNEKYLNKNSLDEATSIDKKPSTLRKLLNKAYDLKNNQDPFGDLRQKKNEILALNFKSEKQRSQNK